MPVVEFKKSHYIGATVYKPGQRVNLHPVAANRVLAHGIAMLVDPLPPTPEVSFMQSPKGPFGK